MQSYKKDFPIFHQHPDLIYLDSAASTQKPASVIDGIQTYLTHSYANIHRGVYSLAEQSEDLYETSKKKVAQLLNSKSNEIIYTYNATYGINHIAQSLCFSDKIAQNSTVLLGIRDHHANIVPRLNLQKLFGFTIAYIPTDTEGNIDREATKNLPRETIDVISCSYVSNVTGVIYNIKKLKHYATDNTFVLIDGSQAVPNFPVDVQQLQVDCLIFTAHKIMADTGLGVIFLKKEHINQLSPLIVGGGIVEHVQKDTFSLRTNWEKFEPGTPHIVGAVSLLHALEYIESIGGMQTIWEHEQTIITYIKKKYADYKQHINFIGDMDTNRVGVFSFTLPHGPQGIRAGELFAQHNICIRCGAHCAHPFLYSLGKQSLCRISSYIYTEKSDIDTFFDVLVDIN